MLCPAHADTHPSCKVSDEFVYCFSCGWNADAAGLEAKLTNRPVGDVLKEWGDGKPIEKVKVKSAQDWRRDIWYDWINRSQELIREVRAVVPERWVDAALVDIDDLLEFVWAWLRHPPEGEEMPPYRAAKFVNDAINELSLWHSRWTARYDGKEDDVQGR
jgi:hypothetical protein